MRLCLGKVTNIYNPFLLFHRRRMQMFDNDNPKIYTSSLCFSYVFQKSSIVKIINGVCMSKKKPNTFFICCSDNRIVSHCFTSKKQDDLFVLRNIGNLIPPYKELDMAVASAIEYAVNFLNIPHIIICGHSDCGGMKAVLEGAGNTPTLSKWIKYVVPTNGITSPDELSKVNVIYQIKNLMTYPVVAKGLSDGILTIDGWWLDLDTDVVYCHDEKTGDWNVI